MNCWNDFEKRFASQGNKDKGDLFEQFCKALIATHKFFIAEEVYLGHEIPTYEVIKK